MTIKKSFILLALLFLLSGCNYNKRNDTAKSIQEVLGKDINRENLIEIASSARDIAIYQDERKIHYYVFQDSEILMGGVVDIDKVWQEYELSGSPYYWSTNSTTDNRMSVIWGVVLNTEPGNIFYQGKPLESNLIVLEEVSFYYKIFNEPLELPIEIEYQRIP
ncbi:hypothetical protein [Alkaliphilus crotonatoxidans]